MNESTKTSIIAVINTIKEVFDHSGVVGYDNANSLIACVIELNRCLNEREDNENG